MITRHLIITLGVLMASPALADQCSWLDHATGKSANGRYVIKLDREKDRWKGNLQDTKTGGSTTAWIKDLDRHAHFSALVTNDGDRIVIFEPSIAYTSGGNVQVYDRDLNLLKGFSLKELLTEIDSNAVRYTVSHCRFTADSKDEKSPFWLEDDGKRFAIYPRSKRTAIVSLVEPKIIPTPDVIPEVFEFEEGPPPGNTDLERLQGQRILRPIRAGRRR